MIAEDRARPLAASATMVVGDARFLPLVDGCIGGVLTSPPYLSRYDYSRITSVLDRLWRAGRPAPPPRQVRATLKSRGGTAPGHGAADDRLPDADQVLRLIDTFYDGLIDRGVTRASPRRDEMLAEAA
jgi:hypothetical protein